MDAIDEARTSQFAPGLLAGLVIHAAAAVLFFTMVALRVGCDVLDGSSYGLTVAIGLDIALAAAALVIADRRWGVNRTAMLGFALSLVPAAAAVTFALSSLTNLPPGCAY